MILGFVYATFILFPPLIILSEMGWDFGEIRHQ